MENLYYYNKDFEVFAKCDTLEFGSKCAWYLHENVDDCIMRGPKIPIGSRLWDGGWFAAVRYINHDELRDSPVEEWRESVISGPYPDEQEALDVAEENLEYVKGLLGA